MANHLVGRVTNQKGYMAVFVAIIFQLLFVLFAMVINVGLFVHDKINLQNSADLAAFYAAQKQAEILNTMAHSNYQIRQAWKLLAWRVRMLGDMGSRGHPLFDGPNVQNPNDFRTPDELIRNDWYPAVCVGHSWWDFGNVSGPNGQRLNFGNQNFCDRAINDNNVVGPIPPDIDQSIRDLFPFMDDVYQYSLVLQGQFSSVCQAYGSINFSLAAYWMKLFKMDIENRSKVIEQLAANLNQANFMELEGGSVRDGALETLKRNLTKTNRSSVSSDEEENFKFYNSFSHPQANVNPWIRRISVFPRVYYIDTISAPSASSNDCRAVVKPCYELPTIISNEMRPQAEQLRKICDPISSDASRSATIGYEKNPWVMGYVGVEVRAAGRRPFAPFGKTVEMVARAYAQPFGGRMGPWFKSGWSSASPFSDVGDKTDMLLPDEEDPQLGITPTATGAAKAQLVVPNYSRYPGDTMGLRSKLALGAMRSKFVARGRLPEPFGGRLKYNFWESRSTDFNDPKADVLAWEYDKDPPFNPKPASGNYNGPWIREFEGAAIIPDLFDVMYYSIEPQFYQNYIARTNTDFFGDTFKLRPDLGYRAGSGFEFFNVLQQIQNFRNIYSPLPVYIAGEGEYLTSWAPNQRGGSFDYEFPSSVYAKCNAEMNPNGRGIPGGCSSGGRTGYSVKLVSESFLRSQSAVRTPTESGPIKNPPPF